MMSVGWTQIRKTFKITFNKLIVDYEVNIV